MIRTYDHLLERFYAEMNRRKEQAERGDNSFVRKHGVSERVADQRLADSWRTPRDG